MKIRYLLIFVAIILFSSLENFSFNTSVKYYTTCIGENVCFNIKYKIRDNNFHYKAFVFAGKRNVKLKEKEKFVKHIEKNKKSYPDDATKYLKGLSYASFKKFYTYLENNKPVWLQLYDKDGFKIFSKKIDFNDGTFIIAPDDRNKYTGIKFQGVFTLSENEKKDFHSLSLPHTNSFDEESSKLYW